MEQSIKSKVGEPTGSRKIDPKRIPSLRSIKSRNMKNAIQSNANVAKSFLIVSVACCILGCSGASSSSQNNEGHPASVPASKKVGEQVEVGNFSYVVNNAKFASEIGNEFSRKKADGVFLIINVTFRNNDKDEHTLDNSLFKLTDEKGTAYESSTDGETALEMSGKETLFLKQCNPNITKSGLLVFEVPQTGVYDLHLSGGFWDGNEAVVKVP